VLSDGKTRLELTVVNNSGVLKGHIFEAGKSVTVEDTVRLNAENGVVYVYSSGSQRFSPGFTRDTRTDEPIELAFNFNADGSSQVLWRRGRTNQFTPLNVESRVR